MGTIEGNKLIAEFMGAKWAFQSEIYNSWGWRFDEQRPTKHHSLWAEPFGLLYHESWDWLMPVIGKIESLDFEVSIYNSCCTIYAPDAQQTDAYVIPISDTNAVVGKSKIGSTWISVVAFIQWFKGRITDASSGSAV